MSAATILAVLTAVYEFARLILSNENEEKISLAAKDLAQGLRLKNETKDTSLLDKAISEHLGLRKRKL